MEQENSGSGQDNSRSVKETVEQVKQRIIATGKLMKYLQNAKKDLDEKNQQIDGLKSSLTTSINAMQVADLKTKTQQSEIDTLKQQVRSLQTQIAETSSAAGSTQELKAQLKAMENERNEKDRLAQSKQSYIQQLEAQCELLRESSNQQSEKAKSSSKQSSELKKKKEEVAALKQRLSLAEKKVESLTADLGRVQEEKETLDEDMIEMKMNNDMIENELDELKESLQNMIPKREFEKHKTDYNHTISNLKSQLESPRKQIQDLKKLNALKDQEITYLKKQLESPSNQIQDFQKQNVLKDQESPGDSQFKDQEMIKLKNENAVLRERVLHMHKRSAEITKVSPQIANQDLVKRFHKVRGEFFYYQRETKRLREQLKELSMRESLSYGLDDMDDMPDSPIAADFFEDELDVNLPMHPKSSEPQSIASLMNSRRASSSSLTSSKSSSPASPTARRKSTLSQPSLSPILTPASPTEKAQLRKSGLIAPPPNTSTTITGHRKSIATGKNKQSKLMKFVNARNSEKMLNSKPLPVPITPTVTDIQQPVRVEKSATFIEEPTSVRGAKRPVSEAQNHTSSKATEKAVKKPKPVAIDSKVASMERLLKTGTMPDLQDIAAHITEFLDEIDEMYSTMNSPAEPVNKEPTPVGNPKVLQVNLPQGMVQREKLCILLVCLLAKHCRSDYEVLMQGIFSRLYTCENDKAINNKLIRYVRLVAAMGKFNNQPELVRSYIYSIVKSRNKISNVIAALLNVFYIYKECLCNPALASLHHDSNHQPENMLLANTLQACMAHIIRANDTPPNVKSMYDKLIQETGWSSQIKINTCIDDAMNILDAPKYLEMFQKPEEYKELRRSIIMSIELCFMIGHKWEYTYDTFIRQKLWPLLSKPIVNDVAIELLGTLGSTGVSRDPFKPDKPGVVTLLNKLIQIVEWPHPMPEEERHIQDTAAISILAIAGNQPQYKKFVSDYYASKKK